MVDFELTSGKFLQSGHSVLTNLATKMDVCSAIGDINHSVISERVIWVFEVKNPIHILGIVVPQID